VIFFQVIVRGVLNRPIRRISLHHALCVELASLSLQGIGSEDRLQSLVRIVPDDATHACMQNLLQPHTASAADRTKSDLLTRAAQRRREIERDGTILAEPAVIDEQPVLMRGNSFAPMWSAIHD
jgi:hypothetical protein